MKDINRKKFSNFIPSPFSLAILLTFATFLFALFMTGNNKSFSQYVPDLFLFWEQGFWDLLKFAMQMMLMLVLGNVLALTRPFEKIMNVLVRYATNTANAALIVSLSTVIMAYLNWGLGLIFGALLARAVAHSAYASGMKLNYPMIGAAGYGGLMIWHGGLSGSAPLKIAEEGHFLEATIGVIPASETLLSDMNIVVAITTVIAIPLFFYFLGKRNHKYSDLSSFKTLTAQPLERESRKDDHDKLENSRWFSLSIAIFMLLAIVVKVWNTDLPKILNINFINLILLVASLFLYPSVKSFAKAVGSAVSGSAGIMLQFPFYAGIMGIMQHSGLSDLLTGFFISISNQQTFPIFTMFSAGLVNFFVPSGGGQWAVQGPIIVDAATQVNIPVSKAVMALAYGDQLTNMIQPFWALPLLAITGLKARSVLPYSFILMILGSIIFGLCLLLF